MENRKREVLRMSNRESNQLTRECLQTALIYLMSQMPFEKITITELVRRSGVSRTAFYRNYSSKEEILNELCTSFLDSLAASFAEFGFQKDPKAWYYNFFQAVKENAMLFDLLLQAHMLNSSLFNDYSISKKLSSPTAPECRWTPPASPPPITGFSAGKARSSRS